MFGYIMMNAETLPKERQERFKSFYCGLCSSLRRQYGLKGTMALSYDMTFLALLLNALYEPEEQTHTERCLPHMIKPHNYVETPVMAYCADMNIALSYFKFMDDWCDDKSIPSTIGVGLLCSSYRKVERAYPEQCEAINDWLREIARIESSGINEVDPPANATGKMLGALFAYKKDDIWAETLHEIGDGLGRFIYMMDAYDDLDEDVKRSRYNPLKAYRDNADYEDFCRSAMLMHVADATRAFEMLPIERDVDILRNILYSGIWTKYAMLRKKHEPKEKEHENA